MQFGRKERDGAGMTDSRNDYKGWWDWLMRNCAGCSVEPCAKYQRERAAVEWGKMFWNEPNCEQKVPA